MEYIIQAIAIDDEPLALDIIENYCNRISGINLVRTFTNTNDALSFIRENEVQLLLLDIQMPQKTGFEFYLEIKKEIPVIFTTAFPDYALSAYYLHAVDYLLKPFPFDRFERAVQKASKIIFNNTLHSFFIKTDKGHEKIFSDEILYIEALDDYIKIFFKNAKPIVVRYTLKAILEKLPATHFIRVHRSFIVAINKIEIVKNKSVFIKNVEIPIGISYEEFFMKQIENNF